ncbi:MAG: hypothetical protein GY953_10370 [bacterium]|nr:hypothetical protein [bacterium]
MLAIGATLATLGLAPFESAQRRIAAVAADFRWSHFPLTTEELDHLRAQALTTALHEGDLWPHAHRSALPLVCDEVYSPLEPVVDGATFELLTEDQLQSRADDAGVYWSYHVSSPEFTWATAIVWVSYQQHFARGSDLIDMGSQSVQLECVPVSSRWRCAIVASLIA